MFNTVADSIQPSVTLETPSLFSAFSESTFTAPSPDLEPSASDPGVLSTLKASLSASQREAMMLAKLFGVTSIHKVAGSAAGRSAYTAICRLREKKIEPPDELKRALSAGAGATGVPEIDNAPGADSPAYPTLH